MATLAGVGRWDEEADVVVLGSGLAGCVSAIEAYDTDSAAEVLLLEKMPEHRGRQQPLRGAESLLSAS